ncbi:MAG: hypothetical protein ACRDNK_02915, partial [Solirubrobacteraceae bacterium]
MVSASGEELDRLERVIDTSKAASEIERLLPVGVRPRQLSVRTLLFGMLLVAVQGRPAHLRRIHQTLIGLPEPDQWRLGISTRWKTGEHRLTYRQVERTFKLVVTALSKHTPDGRPSPLLSDVLDRLLEASITVLGQPASGSYAVDWTDLEAWARPPHPKPGEPGEPGEPGAEDTPPDGQREPSGADQDVCRGDREAAWGHRNTNHPAKREIFYGYYLQAVTCVADEHGPEVPGLVRRIQIAACDHDPPAQIVPVLQRMATDAIKLSDILADSGYAYRVPTNWALPVRALGADLVQDLHPHDRGPKGTHQGATISNGNLYCPATPTTLLRLGPLAPNATSEQTNAHDQQSRELARYKLGAITRPDRDRYHRVACPATTGKLRCPLRP